MISNSWEPKGRIRIHHSELRVEDPHLTINVPVVYMAQDVRYLMILIGENPFRGPLEGVGTENRDFFGP